MPAGCLSEVPLNRHGAPLNSKEQSKEGRTGSLQLAPAAIGVLLLLLLLLRLLMDSSSHRWQAFGMSFGAGAATGIGASFALCTNSFDKRLLACTLSFFFSTLTFC